MSTISIIIPFFNAEPYLNQAVSSVLRQISSTSPFTIEVILVNDGSTDSSGVIAQELKERAPQIVYIEQTNGGVSNARNAGIRRASGEIICFLDADDEYPDDTLAFFLSEIEALRPIHGDLLMVRGLYQPVTRTPEGGWNPHGEPIARSCMTASAQTRMVIEQVGFFDEELSGSEDLDWLLRAQTLGVAMPLRERVVLLRRWHESNATKNGELMRQEHSKAIRKLLQRHHHNKRHSGIANA